ncbi:MAG: IS66 family insertion sequence element accessory protein TnpB [Lachnospiraceae bacterium]|nr:IS66 family insertion sequence element accessory protein TnpB [Lachnospiraceae bacterium]
MLADITGCDHIYLICGYTDMRKSIDGLCGIIHEYMSNDQPDTRSMYLFCGRRRDRIKALIRDDTGLVLIYKRLTVEGCYRWPRNRSEVRNLTWKEFGYLMDGIDIDQPKAIKAAPEIVPADTARNAEKR